MMRILALGSTFPRWHGDTVPPFVFALCEGLAAKGHEVHVLAPHDAGAAVREVMDGIHVHRFRYARERFETLCYRGGILENLRGRRARWALVAPFLAAELAGLVRLVRKHRIDVVHAHWVVPQGLVAALARPLLPCPLVVSAHGGDVFAVNGGVRRILLRFAARTADARTSNSSAMQHELRRLTGMDSTVIPMGVDLTRFAQGSGVACKVSDDDPNRASLSGSQILFVGRLVEKKGVRHLIEAMPALRSVVPDARLRIVGDGPERTHLMRRTQELGLNGGVKFEGAVPNAQLPGYYRDADLFVAPSVRSQNGDTEGLGVVLLEAAGCGLPIIASNIGGIPDVVRHGKTGLLVEPENAEALAAAMRQILTDPELRERVAANGRKLVEERFSWNSVVDQFDDLLTAVRRRR